MKYRLKVGVVLMIVVGVLPAPAHLRMVKGDPPPLHNFTLISGERRGTP